tara:strand:+ start:5054 stop:5968 length:915 start_codon:yes stop_codon:yes gene_type:complete
MQNPILILFLALFVSKSYSQDCSDLFISEYIEGPGQNNAIEIFNPTSNEIDLSGYVINRYSNGANTGPQSWPLSGIIASGDVIVLGNGQTVDIDLGTYISYAVDSIFYSLLDDHCTGDYNSNSTFYFNGNDAITLEKNGENIDIFGKVGEDPGNAWTDDTTAGFTDANGGTWWTKRQTLVRKPTIKKGVAMNPIVFNPVAEYDSLPDATYNGMGYHICDCIQTSILDVNKNSYIVYPNPVRLGEDININATSNITSIEIYCMKGTKILESNKKIISTSVLSKGTYVLHINFDSDKLTQHKLIIE